MDELDRLRRNTSERKVLDAARDAYMIAARLAGASVTDIADAAGLSRSQAHVVLGKLPPRPARDYTFHMMDADHHFAPTGAADNVSGRVKVSDNDLQLGDSLVWDGVYIRVNELRPTSKDGEYVMRGAVDWERTRESYVPRPAEAI